MNDTAARIWEMARASMPSRILLTAVELGVFAELGDAARTSVEVAGRIGAEPRATDRLMNALVALGLLTKEGDLFRNGEAAKEVLVPGKPGYVGDALGHMMSLWGSWSTMTAAVRAGTSVIDRSGVDADRFTRPFIAAMHCTSTAQASNVVAQIDLKGVRRVLDVGGGSGGYSIGFCRAKPDIQAVVFDLPEVVALTRQYVAEAGLSDRISTVAGDFNVDDLPSGFDLAFLSQVLHSYGHAQNAKLIKRVFRALNPGGTIVVQDFVMDEDRTSPANAALFALNMLVGTSAGDTYTESEIRGWFEAAGFTDIRRADPPETQTTLVIGRKA